MRQFKNKIEPFFLRQKNLEEGKGSQALSVCVFWGLGVLKVNLEAQLARRTGGKLVFEVLPLQVVILPG